MLDTLRSAASTWVAGVIIGLLVISFAIWGIGDVFRGNVNTSVATVGDLDISSEDFDREFRAAVRRLSQQSGGAIDSLRAREMGYDMQVLNSMVQRTALDSEVMDMGLTISDDKLAETIRTSEIFQSTFGRFSKQTYEQLLAENNLTPQMYENALRGDIARDQLLDSLRIGTFVPRSMAEAMYQFRRETRVIEYLIIPPDVAGDIEEPTEEQVVAFHTQNAPQFTAPEYRSFKFLQIEPADLLKQVEVDETEVEDRFEFDKGNLATPEKRTVQILSFLSEEDAVKASNGLKEGMSFEGLTLSLNRDLEDITQTDVTAFQITDSIISKTAFELEENAISDPVNGQLGWAIVRVTSITPSEELNEEEAKANIREEIALDLSKDLLYEMLNELDDQLASGATLEEAAAGIDMPLTTVAFVDRNGIAPDGKGRSIIPTFTGFMEQVFMADQDIESDLIDTPTGGIYVFRVDNIKAPELKPLETVREDVLNAVKTKQLADKMDVFAKSIQERANAGESFDNLAGELERSVLSTEPFERGFSDDTISFSLGVSLFEANIGEFVYGPIAFGDSYVVAVTRNIIKPSIEDGRAEIDQVVEQLKFSYETDVAAQYVNGLQRKLNVRTYPTVIDNVLGAAPN